MRHQTIIACFGLGLGLLITTGCGPSSSEARAQGKADTSEVVAQDAANKVDKSVPDMKRLDARSAERLDMIVAGDWIQTYDFNAPKLKAMESIGSFLPGKEFHEYRNPSKPRVIGTEGNLTYMELSILWEPHHPILSTVQDKPKDMTQELHLIETWEWVDGEWFFLKQDRQNEFLAAHPEIGKKSAGDKAGEAQAAEDQKPK